MMRETTDSYDVDTEEVPLRLMFQPNSIILNKLNN